MKYAMLLVSMMIVGKAQAKEVSFGDFKKAALNAAGIVQECDGTQFSVKGVEGGLKIEITGDQTAELTVGAQETIQLVTDKPDQGLQVYRTHQGTLSIQFADDAFDRIDINSNGHKAECEVDF